MKIIFGFVAAAIADPLAKVTEKVWFDVKIGE